MHINMNSLCLQGKVRDMKNQNKLPQITALLGNTLCFIRCFCKAASNFISSRSFVYWTVIK